MLLKITDYTAYMYNKTDIANQISYVFHDTVALTANTVMSFLGSYISQETLDKMGLQKKDEQPEISPLLIIGTGVACAGAIFLRTRIF